MKFSYDNIPKNEIIERFQIIDDKIVVWFLDGHYYIEEYSEEIIQDLIDLLLKQAIDRDKLEYPIKIRSEYFNVGIIGRLEAIIISGIGLIAVLSRLYESLTLGNIAHNTSEEIGIMNYIMRLCNIFSGTCFPLIVLDNRTRRQDLQKYHIFLSIKDMLDQKNLDDLLPLNQRKLDINTLDDFSLKDIKAVEKILDGKNDYSRILKKFDLD